MKLELQGHDYQYAVDQIMTVLFPGETHDFGPVNENEENWARVELAENAFRLTATTRLHRDGIFTVGISRATKAEIAEDPLARNRVCQRIIKRSFYKAAVSLTGKTPPWGALTGIRPARLMTQMLDEGMTERQALRAMSLRYFVTPKRANLCLGPARASRNAQRELTDRDFSLYVGIPFCPTRCTYCSFVSASVERTFHTVEPYLDALCREIEANGKTVRTLGLRPKSLYIGGGTPTTLTAPQLARLTAQLARHFDLSALAEYTVEAGRPDTVTKEKLTVLQRCGVTRVSVNPQSMQPRVLQAIGRRHTAEDVERAMFLARCSGIPHINMDLIAGLPEDSIEGFRDSLDRCIAMGPDNITVHTLALKKGAAIQLEGRPIPAADTVAAMLDYADETLSGAGFAPYYLYRQKYMSGNFENIGWSKPGAEGLYNIYIMEELHTILALGAGGSTKMVDPKTGRIDRFFNCKYAKEYIDHPEKREANRRTFETTERALLRRWGVALPDEKAPRP